MNKKKLAEHLKNEHQISPITTYIKEIVYGGNDGIVTTFAVVAGFSGANIGELTLNFSILTVLLFGLANLFADGAAMGLGNFLSIRSEQKLYKNCYDKELLETKRFRQIELDETEFILREKGYSKEDAASLTKLMAKNTDFWVQFMVQYECHINNPEDDSPLFSGLATFGSFVAFGIIPIIPYFFMTDISKSFLMSSIFTIGALGLLGIFRAYATKDSYIISIIETLLIGGTAASLAYLVGFLFKL